MIKRTVERINFKMILRIFAGITMTIGAVVTLFGFAFIAWAISESNSEVEMVGSQDFVPLNENIKEYQFLDNIHLMTHQKVYADEKWGSAEITKERIVKMREIIYEKDFANEQFLSSALSQWEQGNFENAVDVHNYIWEQRNGTAGKATRLLTDEEEQEYIEEHFE
ncbi:DUF6241 domain-containing protein [Aquibacillus albus]|uniref:Uncharacterized protein n=1 Tax=Aquibacillus albus TaxID=1168171 RepID=A0ABS2N484_9BACI|nr:DUF6241 domain-containing protein [Aquibacillus albus]MBM7572913.1 hypothetical protein [Aquibacillus albus]